MESMDWPWDVEVAKPAECLKRDEMHAAVKPPTHALGLLRSSLVIKSAKIEMLYSEH